MRIWRSVPRIASRPLSIGIVGAALIGFSSPAFPHSLEHYCKVARSMLAKDTLASAQYQAEAVSTSPRKGVLYVPIGSIALPVAMGVDAKVTKLMYFDGRSSQGGSAVFAFVSDQAQSGFLYVPQDLSTKRALAGVSNYAAFSLPGDLGPQENPKSPKYPKFWLTLAQRRGLDGDDLLQAMAAASLDRVRCISPTPKDWLQLFALNARAALMPPSLGGSKVLGADVERYKGWYVFRVRLKQTQTSKVIYGALVGNGKRFAAEVIVRGTNEGELPNLLPIRRDAVDWKNQPVWVRHLSAGLKFHANAEWKALVSQLRTAGVGVRDARRSPTPSPSTANR